MSDLDYFLSLPWTIERSEMDDDGHYFVLTIAELPGFVVAGRTEAEVDQEFWPALSAFLSSYLDHGEVPPVPRSMTRVVAARMRARRAVWDVFIGSNGRARAEHAKVRSVSQGKTGYAEDLGGRLAGVGT